MYCLSCFDCNIEYHFRWKRRLKAFGRVCPTCGRYLSCVPIPRYTLTPPPNMREVKRDVTVVEVGK